MRIIHCLAGAFRRNAEHYGDAVTVGNVDMAEGYGPEAMGDRSYFLNIMDVAAGYICPISTPCVDVYHTNLSLLRVFGGTRMGGFIPVRVIIGVCSVRSDP